MPADYFFNPATINLPSLDALRWFAWEGIDDSVKNILAQEYQYFIFHTQLLQNLHFTENGFGNREVKPYQRPVTNSLRAGAIKTGLLLGASIVEGVLGALAAQRNYPLPAAENRRTFGKIIEAWETSQGIPPQEFNND